MVDCTLCYEPIPEDQLTHSKSLGDIPGAPYHQNCLEKQEKDIREIAQQKEKYREETEPQSFRELVLEKLASNKKNLATELLTRHITTNNNIYTTRDDKHPQIWIYQEGIYRPNGKTYIQEITRKILGESYTTHTNNNVLEKIQADTYIDQDEFFNKEQQTPNLIPVANGILDIKTKKLQPFNPKLFFFNKLPVTYNTTKECTKILEFVNQIVKKEDVNILQEFTGFCLLRDYKFEKALMLSGKGRNGKSKFITLIKLLLGGENVSGIGLSDMEKDQFSLSELHGKLANIAGDITNKTLQNTSNFKSVTGRDIIHAARKFMTRIKFVNYAKMIFAANEIPRTNDISQAFFFRWILVDFPYTFLSQKELNKLPQEEKELCFLQNPQIVDDITSQEEMSGFLNWALEGYERLAEVGDFSFSPTTDQVKNEWTRKSDSFRAFCMDCVEEQYNGELPKTQLRQAYQLYCKTHKLKGVNDKTIAHVLAIDYGAVTNHSSIGDSKEWVWWGIGLKSEVLKTPGQAGQAGQGISTLGEFSKNPIGKNTLSSLSSLSCHDEKEIDVNFETIQRNDTIINPKNEDDLTK